MYAPGYETPGIFSSTAAGMGLGRGSLSGMGMQGATGSALFGSQVNNALFNVAPNLGWAGLALAGTTLGPLLEYGGATPGLRSLGWAMNYSDPLSIAMGPMMSAGRMGWGAGAALGRGAISRGVLGAMGAGLGAATVAAPIAAAGYAVSSGIEYATQQAYQGGQNYLMGQTLANQFGARISPGQSVMGQGAAMASMFRELQPMFKDSTAEDFGRYAQELNSQKIFQATRDLSEFRKKFTEVMKAVKEISKVTQTTVDDAIQLFGELRQQGFYNTADVKSQAAITQARATASGVDMPTMLQMGSAGAQLARQYGMKGRVGSEMATRLTANVAMGVRSGLISEESVEERGGAEAVAMQMAGTQMGFLSSSRGRMLIASMMGQNGSPDMDRLQRFLGGQTGVTGLVESAAGRGLGVLRAAGTAEARAAFAPYAGMAMVQMAAAQSQTLSGGVSQESLLRHLGTMGLGREDARMMIGSVLQMPEQLRAESVERRNALVESASEDMAYRQSYTGRLAAAVQPAGEYFQGVGSSIMQTSMGAYDRAMWGIRGGRTYLGGDDLHLRRAVARGGGRYNISGREVPESYLGTSVMRDLRDDYFRYSEDRTGALRQDDVALGSGFYGAGHFSNRVISRQKMAAVDAAAAEGRRYQMKDPEQARWDRAVATGDMSAKFDAFYAGEVMGGANYGAASGFTMGAAYLASKVSSAVTTGLDFVTPGGSDLLRERRAQDEDAAAFFMAREAGYMKGSYQDYMAGNLRDKDGNKIDDLARTKIRAMFGGDRARAAGLGAYAGRGPGGGGARDVASARDDLRRAISGVTQTGIMGKRGTLGQLWGKGGNIKGLEDALLGDGQTLEAFSQFIESMDQYNPNGSNREDVDRFNTLLQKLGPDSAAAKAAQELYSNLQQDATLRRDLVASAKTGDLGNAAESYAVSQAISAKLPSFLEGATIAGKRVRSGELALGETEALALRKLQGALGTKDVGRVDQEMGSFTRALAQGGLTAAEKESFGQIFGMGGAMYATTFDSLQKMTSKDTKAVKKALGEQGLTVSDDELQRLLGSKDRVGDTYAFLKSKGISPISGASTAGEKATDASAGTAYVEANTRFVQAVETFVARLQKSGIDVGDFKGETEKDQGILSRFSSAVFSGG